MVTDPSTAQATMPVIPDLPVILAFAGAALLELRRRSREAPDPRRLLLREFLELLLRELLKESRLLSSMLLLRLRLRSESLRDPSRLRLRHSPLNFLNNPPFRPPSAPAGPGACRFARHAASEGDSAISKLPSSPHTHYRTLH